jgi:fatty acid desaturase
MRETSIPAPASLRHLRPRDRDGAAAVAAVATTTAVAVWLSLVGGAIVWLGGQLLLGFAFVQWFVLLHECGHDTLFRNRRLNAAAGTLAGALTLIPFRAWRRVHARHHKWTGWQDLDPTTEALVPHAIGPVQRAIVNTCWRLWIPLFSVLYRLENFWNLPRLFRMFPRRADRRAILRDTALVAGAALGLAAWLGPAAFARVTVPALLVSLTIEDLLLLSQHTHIPQHVSHGAPVRPFPAATQAVFTRSLKLPSLLSRALLHFDAHELHHTYPFVPGYRLHRIGWTPGNAVSGWRWVTGAKRLRGDVLLFQNRVETGWDI